MPVVVNPSGFTQGYTYNDTTKQLALILDPYCLPGLDSAEANNATGDFRKVLYALLKGVYANYIKVAAADKPKKFSVTKSARTSIDANTVRETFTFSFDLDTSQIDVTNEA